MSKKINKYLDFAVELALPVSDETRRDFLKFAKRIKGKHKWIKYLKKKEESA